MQNSYPADPRVVIAAFSEARKEGFSHGGVSVLEKLATLVVCGKLRQQTLWNVEMPKKSLPRQFPRYRMCHCRLHPMGALSGSPGSIVPDEQALLIRLNPGSYRNNPSEDFSTAKELEVLHTLFHWPIYENKAPKTLAFKLGGRLWLFVHLIKALPSSRLTFSSKTACQKREMTPQGQYFRKWRSQTHGRWDLRRPKLWSSRCNGVEIRIVTEDCFSHLRATSGNKAENDRIIRMDFQKGVMVEIHSPTIPDQVIRSLV
jgi:hypothetical protein